MQVFVDMIGNGTQAMLNRLRIFVREDPESQVQTPYDNAQGSSWIHTEDEKTSMFELEQVI